MKHIVTCDIKNIIRNHAVYYIMKGPELYTWSPSDDDKDPEELDKPIRRGKIKRKGVGLISFDEYEDHVDLFCPHCEKYSDMKNKLGPRILEKVKPIPEDHDSWVQCYKCGNIYDIHEVEKQKNLVLSELKGHIVDSPFEAKQTIIESIPTRASKGGKTALAKRSRERNRPHHKDPEIDTLMRIYRDRVTVLEDTDP